jgi:GMP synthase (glutamine-hydrolysing)
MMETRHAQIHAEKLLIVDFGAQYTQLIARRIREAGVYCEIHPYDADPEFLRAFRARGVVLSGGPESVTVTETPRIPQVIFELGVPILGIC